MNNGLSFDNVPSLSESFEDNRSEEEAVMEGLDKLIQDEDTKKEASKESAPADKEKKDPNSEFNKQELLEIFDAIMFEGEYRETINLGKKYTAVLRSRTVGESNTITRKVDSLDLKTFMAVQNITNVMTLTYSLVEYNGKDLSALNFKDKLSFVESLPKA